MEPLISVIIPVYKAERFLGKCLDSILGQTYRNLEIVLVDDGSPDNSGALCDQYGAQDVRVRVIHQQNAGASAARNRGLDVAQGEYISFVDSDDFLASDYIEILYNNIAEHRADMACCDFYELMNGEIVRFTPARVTKKRLVDEPLQLFRDAVEGIDDYACSVWGKLIKAEYAKQVRFQSLRYGEDQIYMYDLLLLTPRVYLNDYKGYYYIVNESGAMMSAGSNSLVKCTDDIKMRRYKLDHLPLYAQKLRPKYYAQYAQSVAVLARSVAEQPEKSVRKANRKVVNTALEEALAESNLIPMAAKLRLSLWRYAPEVYRKLLYLRAKMR